MTKLTNLPFLSFYLILIHLIYRLGGGISVTLRVLNRYDLFFDIPSFEGANEAFLLFVFIFSVNCLITYHKALMISLASSNVFAFDVFPFKSISVERENARILRTVQPFFRRIIQKSWERLLSCLFNENSNLLHFKLKAIIQNYFARNAKCR